MGQVAPDAADDRRSVHTYKQTNHGDLQLTVDHPPQWSASDSRPAFVFFFGGGWAFSAIEHFERQAKYFAGRGMVAIRPDFRVKDRDGTTPAESVEDAKSAIRWVRANAHILGVDPRRIVAAGGSSGGHLAACTAHCFGPGRVKEDVSVSSAPNALILFNPLLDYAGLREVEQTYPVANDEIARQISPALHLKKGEPPALLLFGSEDVLLDWADTYVETSTRLGNRLDMYVAEGEGHGFFNDAPWYEQTLVEADNFLVSLGYLNELSVRKRVVNTTSQPTGQIPSAVVETLLRIDREYVQAEIDRDVETLARIFADDVRYTGFDGSVVSKDQILAGVQDPAFSVGPIELSDMHVRPLGRHSAIVTGRADLRMHYGDAEYSGAYRFTRVYESRDGTWKMVAGHTAKIPER